LKDYDKWHEKAMEDVQDPEVKLHVSENFRRAREHFYERGKHYSNQQNEVYADASSETLNRAEMESAARNFDDDKSVQKSIDAIRSNNEAFAQRKGLDKAYADGKTADIQSQIRLSVVDSLVNAARDQDAKTYLNTFTGDMNEDDRKKAVELVKDSSSLGTAQRLVDAIPSGVTESEAFDLAKNIKDPHARKLAEQMIEHKYARMAKAEEAQKKDAFNQVWGQVETNGGDLTPFIGWRDKMAPGNWESLEKRARNIRRGVEPETDRDTYHELMIQSAVDPKGFARLNLRDAKYSDSLNETDFKMFVKEQGEINAKGKSLVGEGYLSDTNIIEGILSEIPGIDMSPPSGSMGDAGRKKLTDMRFLLNRAIAAEQERLGKKKGELSPKDVEDTVRGTLRKARAMKTGFWGGVTDELSGDLRKGAEKWVFSVNQIDVAQKKKIVEGFKAKNGIEPDNDKIIEIYNKIVLE
jgi:hypothetical protein